MDASRSRSTPEHTAHTAHRLRRYQTACRRIRAEVWHMDGTHRMARYRQEWPEFWEAVADMVALLDEDHPPQPLPASAPPC